MIERIVTESFLNWLAFLAQVGITLALGGLAVLAACTAGWLLDRLSDRTGWLQ